MNPKGRPLLEDCDITSDSLACVAINAGADPIIRRCRIHDGRASGVLVYRQGQGTLEDCDIFANAFDGVAIRGVPIPPCAGAESPETTITLYRCLREAQELFKTVISGVMGRVPGTLDVALLCDAAATGSSP